MELRTSEDICGPLPMAILTGPLMSVNDTGKVPNRKMAKSQIVLLLIILILNVGRTLILGLTRKQDGRPVGYITLLTLISRPNHGVKNFWRHICGPLPMAILTGRLWASTTPARYQTGKWQNRKLFFFLLLTTSVGRCLLGSPPKQNGRPVGYITLLTLISRPNRGLKNFWRLICGPLAMAKLTGPLMGVNDTGKVLNRKVAKSQIVLILPIINVGIINVGRTLILGLPRKQDGRPVGYITLLTLISRPNRGVKNFWRHICGPLPMAILTGPLMSVNDTGKVPNRKVAKSQIVLILINNVLILILILLLVKIFAPT